MSHTEALMKLADAYAQATADGTNSEHLEAQAVLREAIDAALAQPAEPMRQPLTDEQKRAMWAATDFRGNGGQRDWFIAGIEEAERTLAARWGVTLAEKEGGAA